MPGQIWLHAGRTWSKSGHMCSCFRANGRSVRRWQISGQIWSSSGRAWSTPAEVHRCRAWCGQPRARVGPCWPIPGLELGRVRPELGQVGPDMSTRFDRFSPISTEIGSEPGPTSGDVDRTLPVLGKNRHAFRQVVQASLFGTLIDKSGACVRMSVVFRRSAQQTSGDVVTPDGPIFGAVPETFQPIDTNRQRPGPKAPLARRVISDA